MGQPFLNSVFSEESGQSVGDLLALQQCHRENGDPSSSLHGCYEDKAGT